MYAVRYLSDVRPLKQRQTKQWGNWDVWNFLFHPGWLLVNGWFLPKGISRTKLYLSALVNLFLPLLNHARITILAGQTAHSVLAGSVTCQVSIMHKKDKSALASSPAKMAKWAKKSALRKIRMQAGALKRCRKRQKKVTVNVEECGLHKVALKISQSKNSTAINWANREEANEGHTF